MTDKTCAACDCRLDANSIEVRVGDSVVEVCCAECAQALSEAQTAVDVRSASRA